MELHYSLYSQNYKAIICQNILFLDICKMSSFHLEKCKFGKFTSHLINHKITFQLFNGHIKSVHISWKYLQGQVTSYCNLLIKFKKVFFTWKISRISKRNHSFVKPPISRPGSPTNDTRSFFFKSFCFVAIYKNK